VGTAFLLTAVVGPGIMGERFAGGNVAIALHRVARKAGESYRRERAWRRESASSVAGS